MDVEEYRRRGKEMVDYIADYLQTVKLRRVYPDVQPGYMVDMIPKEAPMQGEKWEDIFGDIERVIMPGITHWQSPHMHAYFPALNSCPSLLGDMLADAIGCLGFTWASSPACTELEVIVMDWLAKMIGLPPCFYHSTSGSQGGGVLQGTASEATLVAMLAARAQTIARIKHECGNTDDIDEGGIISRLVAYCSDQAHSSVEKAGIMTMVKVRFIPSDENLSLRGNDLQKALKEDKENGLIPFYLCATLGTTGACSFDNMMELGPICEEEGLWMHIDAAYAGTAFMCPEFRYLLNGVHFAQSFAFNPSKWMMVHFDCTAMWVKNSAALHRTFNVNPLYLKHDKSGLAIDYMHWQIPLSRRFRSLKLWFVIRSFGIEGLQSHVRKGVRLAKMFEEWVQCEPNFEVAAPRLLGLVVFRLKGPDELTEALLKSLNQSGKVYMVPASLKNNYVIRFTVTSTHTTEDSLLADWNLIREEAGKVKAHFEESGIGEPMENGVENGLDGIGQPMENGIGQPMENGVGGISPPMENGVNGIGQPMENGIGQPMENGMDKETQTGGNYSKQTTGIFKSLSTDVDMLKQDFQHSETIQTSEKQNDENCIHGDCIHGDCIHDDFRSKGAHFIDGKHKASHLPEDDFVNKMKHQKSRRSNKMIHSKSLDTEDSKKKVGMIGKSNGKPTVENCGVLKLCYHVNLMESCASEKLNAICIRANCEECQKSVLGKCGKGKGEKASTLGEHKGVRHNGKC